MNRNAYEGREIESIDISTEKPLSGFEREKLSVERSAVSYFDSTKQIRMWKLWALADHLISSQKLLVNTWVLLLLVVTFSWLVAMFLWAFGPTSRMTSDFLKWWFGAIGAGYLGVTFSAIVGFFFRRKGY